MTAKNDTMELVEIVARAIAADEDTPYRNHAALYRLSARAILTAIEASGRRIVPVEPTQKMIEAGLDHVTRGDIWAAMLSASPKVTT